MSHVAERSFFVTVLSILTGCDRDGGAILYERIQTDPHPGPLEGLCIKLLDAQEKALRRTAHRDGLCIQADEISIQDHWIDADDRTDHESLPKDRELLEIEIQSLEEHIYSIDFRESFCEESFWERVLVETQRPFLATSIDFRNTHCVKTILRHARTRDVGTFWGVTHIPGIVILLEHEGYVVQETQWVRVLGPPSSELGGSALLCDDDPIFAEFAHP